MTTAWTLTAAQVCSDALEHLGVLADGETASASHTLTALRGLDAVLKELPLSGYTWPKLSGEVALTWVGTQTLALPADYYGNPVAFKTVNGRRVPLAQISHAEWVRLTNADAAGDPTHFYIGPNDYLYVWPIPTADPAISLQYQRIVDDAVSGTQPDVPQYWLNALGYGVANEIALKFAVPKAERQEISQRWEGKKALALQNSIPFEDISFQAGDGYSYGYLPAGGGGSTAEAASGLFSHLTSYARGTIGAKLKQDGVNVKDSPYGAMGDGSALDRTAIRNAIIAVANGGGGTVYLPPGLYDIDAELLRDGEGVNLVGAGRESTIIRQRTLNAKIINSTGNYGGIEGMSFQYLGTPAAGATAIYTFGSYNHYRDILVRNGYNALEFNFGVANKVVDFDLFDYENAGLLAQSLNDLFVARFIMNAGNTTRGALGGIRLLNKCEAFVCTDGDILMGKYSITTDAAANTEGVRPAYNKFNSVYFDSATNGSSIDKSVEFDFTSCWWSGGRSGAGFPGVSLLATDSMRFTGGQAFNCGSHGVNVNAAAKRTMFHGFNAESNSVTAASGVGHGINIEANTTDFVVTNCILHNGVYAAGRQGYGVKVAAGTSDRYVIAHNMVSGNVTGGVSDGGTGLNKSVTANW